MKFSDVKFFLTLFIVASIILSVSLYNYYTSGVSDDKTKKEIIVEQGETYHSLGQKLKKHNLIRSEFFYKIFMKLNKPKTLKFGTYILSENMSLKEIIDILQRGSNNSNDIVITFREGINIRKIAKIIEENTNNKIQDVFDLLSDETYINGLINKYWFITDEINNKEIYYPLEGYLFPDTYKFLNKDVSVDKIFEKMLDNMDKKLSMFKDEIEKSKYTVHEILTLASIIELEAKAYDDRVGVSSVFYNRLKNNMPLGSDVTTYYAFKIDDWKVGLGNLTSKCNSYNTRSDCFTGLPVGPISNPGIDSIKAALNPIETDYYYFVADCSGKTYFTKTLNEHEKIIATLKKQNKWCDS